jgi:hypothetical protein
MLQYKGDAVLELRVHMLKWVCACLSILILGSLGMKYIIGNNPFLNQDAITYTVYLAVISAFLWSTLRCGIGTGNVSAENISETNIRKAEHIEREGWFWSATCTSLGLIGTIWGMILMAKAFISFDPADEASTAILVAATGTGMGAALYTTLLGQVCSQILNFQYFNLSQMIEKVKSNETSEVQ